MMEATFFVSIIALWSVVLINLLLTLRLLRRQRTFEDLRKQSIDRENLPTLTPGQKAPDFQAKTVSGTPVRLATYAQHPVLFVFASPHCGSCRKEVPIFVKLREHLKAKADTELVLVSDSGTAETHTWMNTIQQEDGLEIQFPVLVAPYNVSDFVQVYNARGLFPYYCLVNEQGIVQSCDGVGGSAWSKLLQEWGDPLDSHKSLSRLHNRYH